MEEEGASPEEPVLQNREKQEAWTGERRKEERGKRL